MLDFIVMQISKAKREKGYYKKHGMLQSRSQSLRFPYPAERETKYSGIMDLIKFSTSDNAILAF